MNKKFVLTIDQGNTRVKSALFANRECIAHVVGIQELILLVTNKKLTDENCVAICSNVGHGNIDLIKLTIHEVSHLLMKNKFLDMPVHYATTLGPDRLAAAFYTFKHFKDTWIIDSGTFTKVDFIGDSGFDGGFILPGLDLIKNCYASGAKLNKETMIELDPNSLPTTTPEAIGAGVYETFIAPVFSILKKRSYQNILITGGNGEIIYRPLKDNISSASIHLKPDLLHWALLKIAEKANLV